MITFFICLGCLISSYCLYGTYLAKVSDVKHNTEVPSATMHDGVDFLPISNAKAFLIQLLNIAGLGPIFGAIAGALFGPIAFLWITVGSIFFGATHDFISAVMSLKNDGATYGELIGFYLGKKIKKMAGLFSFVLLVLVGVVFTTGPAKILSSITGIEAVFCSAVIFVYYICATILPLDKLIGRIYPLFGLSLLLMAVLIIVALFLKGYAIPELTFTNMHPKNLKIFPLMFISIACGAISGFHATQSPLMTRCIKNEKTTQPIFFGAMIAEGIIALIWAAVAMAVFGSSESLMAAGPAPVATGQIATILLGPYGRVLVLLGVISASVSTGDTAFRSARLALADAFKISQKSLKSRLTITIPLFLVAFSLFFIDFSIIWRYFAFINQSLSVFTLFAISVYLKQRKKPYIITLIPAFIMSMVCSVYILSSADAFALSYNLSILLGLIFSSICVALFFYNTNKQEKILMESLVKKQNTATN